MATGKPNCKDSYKGLRTITLNGAGDYGPTTAHRWIIDRHPASFKVFDHVRLSDQKLPDEPPEFIMWTPFATIAHPKVGKFTIDAEFAAVLIGNFNKHIRKDKGGFIPIDNDHAFSRGEAAPNFAKTLELFTVEADSPSLPKEIRHAIELYGSDAFGIWQRVHWTARGIEAYKNEDYSLFSPEIHFAKEDAAGHKIGPTPAGGALTNRPFCDRMPPLHEVRPEFMAANDNPGPNRPVVFQEVIDMPTHEVATPTPEGAPPTPEEVISPMPIMQLKEAVNGLADEATVDEAVAALNPVLAMYDPPLTIMPLPAQQTEEEIVEEQAAVEILAKEHEEDKTKLTAARATIARLTDSTAVKGAESVLLTQRIAALEKDNLQKDCDQAILALQKNPAGSYFDSQTEADTWSGIFMSDRPLFDKMREGRLHRGPLALMGITAGHNDPQDGETGDAEQAFLTELTKYVEAKGGKASVYNCLGEFSETVKGKPLFVAMNAEKAVTV